MIKFTDADVRHSATVTYKMWPITSYTGAIIITIIAPVYWSHFANKRSISLTIFSQWLQFDRNLFCNNVITTTVWPLLDADYQMLTRSRFDQPGPTWSVVTAEATFETAMLLTHLPLVPHIGVGELSALAQVMACHLVKPLHEPMLFYCQIGL